MNSERKVLRRYTSAEPDLGGSPDVELSESTSVVGLLWSKVGFLTAAVERQLVERTETEELTGGSLFGSRKVVSNAQFRIGAL